MLVFAGSTPHRLELKSRFLLSSPYSEISHSKAVRAYLIQHNFEVCGEAIDGKDVLQKATELQPALIILDIRMPQMNGVEVASVLKGRMPNVRIVLLTMYDEVMGYKSLMSAIGVDATIPKMNCFDSLAECVRGLLSSPTPRSARNEQSQQAQETGSRITDHCVSGKPRARECSGDRFGTHIRLT